MSPAKYEVLSYSMRSLVFSESLPRIVKSKSAIKVNGRSHITFSCLWMYLTEWARYMIATCNHASRLSSARPMKYFDKKRKKWSKSRIDAQYSFKNCTSRIYPVWLSEFSGSIHCLLYDESLRIPVSWYCDIILRAWVRECPSGREERANGRITMMPSTAIFF